MIQTIHDMWKTDGLEGRAILILLVVAFVVSLAGLAIIFCALAEFGF